MYTLETSRRQHFSNPSRAPSISPRKDQPSSNLGFSDRMAQAKAAMLAREQQNKPAMSIPEIVITPSLDPIMMSDNEKP
ncbi:hypothetical protein BUE80_DR002091 [Diplocarpon rosae]|nr:hypothetical protein BUE80_DR002091 [Diplocarpon rosae]